MAIETGQQLLHYRLTEQLGEGGMGVVWLARDTTLDRDVAIKFLTADVAAEPTRMARFEREAKLLASLNHPNIAAVHGFHEFTDATGSHHFIVMEHVPGEDLAERLERGAMPIDETLRITRDVARGMAVAHDSGTIHRDLKPANVRVTPAGDVKVLDFGLARAGNESEADPSNSPTMTSAGSAVGMLLGTAAYMSPEQARGRQVDRRADVWAFGCLLYECLTGKRAFPGETISDILAEVIKSEPDWAALPQETPPSVHRLLRRCLTKDADLRLRDLGDAALDLVETEESWAPTVESSEQPPVAKRRALPLGITVVAIIAALALGFLLADRFGSGAVTGAAPAVGVMHAGVVLLPDGANIAYGSASIGYDSPLLAISPDGSELVYVGRDGDGSRLYHLNLGTFDPPEAIPGTEGALMAAFSPFERSVAFITNDKLLRVDLSGDRLQELGAANSPTRLNWVEDHRIYLGDAQGGHLLSFPERGGAPEDYGAFVNHGLSDVLPRGRYALYSEKLINLRADFATVKCRDLVTSEETVVLERAYDARVRGNRIYFIRDSALMSAPFDLERREVVGEPTIVERGVAVESIFGQAQVAISNSGTIAYLPGADRAVGVIGWVSRQGERGLLPVEPRVYGTLDLSPDDNRIAVGVGELRDYVWIYDIEQQSGRRLPSNFSARLPTWSSTGDSVYYAASGDQFFVVEQPVDSRGEPRRIFESTTAGTSTNAHNSSLIALGAKAPPMIVVVDADGKEIAEPFPGFMPDFSPNGRWMVYNSEQTGVYETVVRSWPDGDQLYSIQAEGGIEAQWTANGELFWRLGNRWYVVQTKTGDKFEWTPPELAFEIEFLDTPGRSYVVTSDGQRLYTIVQAVADIEDRIHVVSGLKD